MRTLATAILVVLLAAPVALSAPSIVGSFQEWDPADPASELTLQANGVWTFTTTVLAGETQYKAVDGDAWGLDFPGANQIFNLASDDDVTWHVNLGATVGIKEGDEYVFHHMNPPIVCGSFMSELGGTDWDQTDTSTTVMADGDDDGVWVFQSIIPAGSYAFKIVLNNNWDQNTSPSGDIFFVSDGTTPVTFSYDMATNTTEVVSSAPPAVIDARIDGDGTDASLYAVQFSDDMDQTTAETEGNYAVTGGPGAITVTDATLDGTDASIVHLTLSPALTEGYDYQFVVTGVTDEGGTPVDPSNNDDCFYLHMVTFEVNMHLYVDINGVPMSVHIQGDTHPLTWDQCGGAELSDGDVDTTYVVDEYFSMGYVCGAAAESTQVKYKYVVDCATWEGDYDFGHYVTLDPNAASQTVNVWWEDMAPSDNITCDVGVRFQVTLLPGDFDALTDTLAVRGSIAPLDWVIDTEMVDDGTNGDLAADDDIYSALVTFPTGSYRYLEYKYAINGAFECDTYPNRMLTLDDIDGCMAMRDGPMEILDIWDWCEPATSVPDDPPGTTVIKSWGQIKAQYR
jgi:hypothetical protein